MRQSGPSEPARARRWPIIAAALMAILPGTGTAQEQADTAMDRDAEIATNADTADRFWIPDSVSPEARRKMEQLAEQAAAYRGAQKPPSTPEEWRTRRELIEGMMAIYNAPLMERLNVTVTEVDLNGTPALKIDPASPSPDGNVLVYIHGGGFTYLSAKSTLRAAALMANATGFSIYSIDYTLAPEAKWDRITNEVIAAYEALLDAGNTSKNIGFFGDSAGGAIAVGSALRLRDEGLPMPAAIVLHSPVTDVAGTGDTFTTLASFDPGLDRDDVLYRASQYAEPEESENPYVSPAYGDYTGGFPPTLIQTGTREMLLSDSVRLYQAIERDGGTAVLDLYEGMPHVFTALLDGTPESDRAYTRAAEFWERHLQPIPNTQND